jgi:hypothetical protein
MRFQPAARPEYPLFNISALDALGSGARFAADAAAGYPLANLALFIPFSVSIPVIPITGWAYCGTIAGGNFDIGVYDTAGTRLVSSGATARAASTVVSTATLTATTLFPDRWYYMAFSADATSNYFSSASIAGIWATQGLVEATTAYVLPASVTFAVTTRAYCPMFGLNLQTTVL